MNKDHVVEVRYASVGGKRDAYHVREGIRLWLNCRTGELYETPECTGHFTGSGYSPGPAIGEWVDDKNHRVRIYDPQPSLAGAAPDLKFDSGKPRWSLLMQGLAKGLAGIVAVLTFGAKKYAAHSWRNVQNGQERYKDALYRHLHAIESGELTDPESGCFHWSHVATNALFLHELEIQNAK